MSIPSRGQFVRLSVILALIGKLLSASVPSLAETQTAACQFVLGFAALRDQLSVDRVGDCLEDQVTLPNGDAHQRTTKGEMVWRATDDVTAFTNGDRTWLVGPNGLQERSNNERFAWELQAESSARVPTPTATESSAGCHFVGGFADAWVQLGQNIVGDCVDDQRSVAGRETLWVGQAPFDVTPGMVVQRTTRGLFLEPLPGVITFTDGVSYWSVSGGAWQRSRLPDRPASTSAPTAPATAPMNAGPRCFTAATRLAQRFQDPRLVPTNVAMCNYYVTTYGETGLACFESVAATADILGPNPPTLVAYCVASSSTLPH